MGEVTWMSHRKRRTREAEDRAWRKVEMVEIRMNEASAEGAASRARGGEAE